MNNTTGNIARIQGDGGTYDSSHHASGSIRCVKDGSTTPVNMCPVAGCAEGQYYCHAELKCKPANQPCGTLTCNTNGVCDEYESCNCSDCNGQTDHCMSQSGTQLICTKDTEPACYTDKFPYCFSACLDGSHLDTITGKCIVDGAPANQNLCKVPSMKINFTRTETVPNSITLGASTVLPDNPTFDLTSSGAPVEDGTLLYDTPNMSVRRHNGYVEFLARKANAVYGYYTGSITLENATVDRVE